MSLPGKVSQERTSVEWVEIFAQSWFSSKTFTEVMMKENVNKGSVLQFIQKLLFVTKVYDIGMVALPGHPYFACSANVFALVCVDGAVIHKLEGDSDI